MRHLSQLAVGPTILSPETFSVIFPSFRGQSIRSIGELRIATRDGAGHSSAVDFPWSSVPSVVKEFVLPPTDDRVR